MVIFLGMYGSVGVGFWRVVAGKVAGISGGIFWLGGLGLIVA